MENEIKKVKRMKKTNADRVPLRELLVFISNSS